MKLLGSLAVALIVGAILIWLLVTLLVGAIQFVGILIAISLAVGVFFAAQKMIGRDR